jgi:hypothetical protein
MKCPDSGISSAVNKCVPCQRRTLSICAAPLAPEIVISAAAIDRQLNPYIANLTRYRCGFGA